MDDIFLELKDKHGHSYEIPKLRLWARMIASSLHDSTDEPPAVPAFQNVTPKRTRNTVGGAINNAAEAFVKYIDKRNVETPTTSTMMSSTVDANPSTSVGISPSEKVDLRMKNLEQLRYLQSLYDDKILTQDELMEQKQITLDALRKLS